MRIGLRHAVTARACLWSRYVITAVVPVKTATTTAAYSATVVALIWASIVPA